MAQKQRKRRRQNSANAAAERRAGCDASPKKTARAFCVKKFGKAARKFVPAAEMRAAPLLAHTQRPAGRRQKPVNPSGNFGIARHFGKAAPEGAPLPQKPTFMLFGQRRRHICLSHFRPPHHRRRHHRPPHHRPPHHRRRCNRRRCNRRRLPPPESAPYQPRYR